MIDQIQKRILEEVADLHTVPELSLIHIQMCIRDRFMYGLKLAGVEMNRKVLSDMAINDAEGFAKLAELAKSKLA